MHECQNAKKGAIRIRPFPIPHARVDAFLHWCIVAFVQSSLVTSLP
jgi:hypothetical protein